MKTGLDTCEAPTAAVAKATAAEIDATFWGAYIGGPTLACRQAQIFSVELCTDLIDSNFELLPLYCGRQSGGPLTVAQGQLDGDEACDIMADNFGWTSGEVICL